MTIKRDTEMKYLGLVLDEKLNYNEYVQSICSWFYKYSEIFNHMKHTVNKKTQGNFTLSLYCHEQNVA